MKINQASELDRFKSQMGSRFDAVKEEASSDLRDGRVAVYFFPDRASIDSDIVLTEAEKKAMRDAFSVLGWAMIGIRRVAPIAGLTAAAYNSHGSRMGGGNSGGLSPIDRSPH